MDIQIRHSNQSDFVAIKKIYDQTSCFSGTLQLPYRSKDLRQICRCLFHGQSHNLIIK